jgi:hypothetical protein
MPKPMTSIGFGAGEVIEVGLSLDDVERLLQEALAERALLRLEDASGEQVIINPEQVKVLQNSGPPQPFRAKESAPEASATS